MQTFFFKKNIIMYKIIFCFYKYNNFPFIISQQIYKYWIGPQKEFNSS